MRLENKVAWVTGGGSGIGRATSMLFAREGASVIVADVDDAAAQSTVKEIIESGGQALSGVGSVTARDDVERMLQLALETYGRLDILINNAGINRDGLVVKIKDGEVQRMDEGKWDSVIEVNLKGTFLCAQAAVVPMIQQGGGRIINTSSIGALGNIGQANYAASKAGVIGLTKTLALEWARYKITVNCIAPGATHTRMTAGIPEKLMEGLLQKIPLGRLAVPDEIAAAHLFLASDEAAYITGQVLFVDGGISVGV
ncbi:MAG TPA: 3-oxoacyl-ACP reductase FabG [Anaerolineales bacterium]|nr:3-oxoacyl-ACP reductase FabG [Anaerolineales bacterium]